MEHDSKVADDLRATGWIGHLRATVALAIPLAGASIGQMAINITDTVMVGRLGATELAATVLATQAFFLLFIFGVGSAQAVMPLVANAIGRSDAAGVRSSVRMGLWVLALYAAAVMLPLWHLEAILLALGQEEKIAALASDYMRVAQWGLLPALFTMGLRSYLAAVGKANVAMWMSFALVGLNAGLNYAFIFGNLGAPALGIVGAAVASIGTKLAGALWLFLYTHRSRDLRSYDLYARFWRPAWPAFAEVVRLGWPIGLMVVAEVGLFTATSVMAGWLGTIPLAAHGIALQLTSVAFMVPIGVASAATVRVGIAHGRGEPVAVARAGWTAVLLAAVFGGVSALVFWLTPEPLVALFLDSDDASAPDVVRAAIPMVYVAAAFQIADGIQAVSAGMLRGLKDTRIPMFIAVTSYWLVGLPAAYWLAFVADVGAVGVWLGLAVGLTLAAVLLTRRFAVASRMPAPHAAAAPPAPAPAP